MRILVTGGAGFIGSHTVRQLLAAGHQVVVVDRLSRGHQAAVLPPAKFVQLDLLDTAGLAALLTNEQIDSVMHFAALAYVGESVQQPLDYYHVNVSGTISLLQAMDTAGVRRLVFSSSCATYGQPDVLPIREETPQQPVNPYGWSKLVAEQVLRDYGRGVTDFGFIALRYFNVAGCTADGTLGEDHEPETHLIPVMLQAVLGRRGPVTLYGTDYPTPDGTCLRDYLHVDDVAQAHLLALSKLEPSTARFFNLGLGRAISVRDVLTAVEAVTGSKVPVEYGPRRPGDPPSLYASSDKIRAELGWQPHYTNLNEIVRTAWNWFKAHPNGYGDK